VSCNLKLVVSSLNHTLAFIEFFYVMGINKNCFGITSFHCKIVGSRWAFFA
jgi:hypothetical protein